MYCMCLRMKYSATLQPSLTLLTKTEHRAFTCQTSSFIKYFFLHRNGKEIEEKHHFQPSDRHYVGTLTVWIRNGHTFSPKQTKEILVNCSFSLSSLPLFNDISADIQRRGWCQTILPPKQPDTKSGWIGENLVVTTTSEWLVLTDSWCNV